MKSFKPQMTQIFTDKRNFDEEVWFFSLTICAHP